MREGGQSGERRTEQRRTENGAVENGERSSGERRTEQRRTENGAAEQAKCVCSDHRIIILASPRSRFSPIAGSGP